MGPFVKAAQTQPPVELNAMPAPLEGILQTIEATMVSLDVNVETQTSASGQSGDARVALWAQLLTLLYSKVTYQTTSTSLSN